MSAVYTALNVFFEEVTDEDEAQFLTLLTRHVRARLSAPAPVLKPPDATIHRAPIDTKSAG